MSWIRNTVIGISGVGIVSAGALGFDATTRDVSGEIIESGKIGIFSIETGDCLNDLDSGEGGDEDAVAQGTGVPCSEPHVYEVYYETFFEELDLAAITERVNDVCLENFEAYVGIPFADSSFYYTTLVPTPESYEEGDREITCLLVSEDLSPKTGSARGSGD